MSNEIKKLTETAPDHVYFETNAISWNTENDGNAARYGTIRAGFDETFGVPDSGERIWLHEPTGLDRLVVNILDKEGGVVSSHTLQGEGMVQIMGGYDINVVTPTDQREVSYMCDYPGVEPKAQ